MGLIYLKGDYFKMGDNIHLLIICNVLKVSSQHQTYCGIDTRWKRKILKTDNILKCTCLICLQNRKLCEKCYWLSGTNDCWFMRDRGWWERKSGECKDFITIAKGKKEQARKGGRQLSIDEINSDSRRARAEWYDKNKGQHD